MWILGSPRSGSTWLLNLLKVSPRVVAIDEPGIGAHLGTLVSGLVGLRPSSPNGTPLRLNEVRGGRDDYFFAERYRSAWLPPLRELILTRIEAQVAEVGRRRGIRKPVVAIKEPHGSIGADLLMEALPASRMIFLVRDGRDVLDSERDAARDGAWGASVFEGFETADEEPTAYLRERACTWLCRTEIVQHAYERHPAALRRMLSYEDLRRDPERQLVALCGWLGFDCGGDAIRRHVEALSFERIEPASRGEGQFMRAAAPGLWRERLDDSEQALLEELIGPKLRELGYD